MKERRENGLCCYYDTQWSPGHKCLKPKLYLIKEICESPDFECTPAKQLPNLHSEKPLNRPCLKKSPKISLHAIIGSINPKTMKVKGRIGYCWIVILIDIRSTDNFIDLAIVSQTRLGVIRIDSVMVQIANED